MPQEVNGLIHKKLDLIENDVREIRDDLTTAINGLTVAVTTLSQKFDSFIHIAQNSIPIKAVFWLMAIMVLGLVGIEGVKALPKLIQFL